MAISVMSLIIVTYGIFACFLWWNSLTAENSPEIIHKAIVSRVKKTHDMQLIDDGKQSLQKRLAMIESAQKSIELEFFIYELDLASRLITQKLVEKAQQGVNVRLLVDFSQPVFKLRPAYARFLNQFGIEIKYYNTSSLFRILTVQHRSHRKLLIVDGESVLTGGRNIGNDYFNLSDKYNFLDSDVYIKGPIVENIRQSFELYWNSSFAEKPQNIAEKDTEELIKAMDFLNFNDEERAVLNSLSQSEAKVERVSQCEDITFVTDFPGVTENNRMVFKTLTQVLIEAKKSITGESPYFVIRHGGLELLKHLKGRGLKTKVLTNGLYSTDAYYTVSALYSALSKLENAGLDLYLFNGRKIHEVQSYPGRKVSNRWGVHAKRAIVDQDISLIGTYNIDPRSANLNSELLIICRGNKEIVTQMKKTMELRFQQSRPLILNNKVHTENIFQDADLSSKIKFALALPLARLFDFLL